MRSRPNASSGPGAADQAARDLARLGRVAHVDLQAGRCSVVLEDDFTLEDVPFAALRAGAVSIWAPPSVGEQVLLLSPEGDLTRSVVAGSFHFDAQPAPADHAGYQVSFADGSWFGYDPGSQEFSVSVNGGRVTIVAAGGVSITGDVEIEGNVSVTGGLETTEDVVADGVSLKDHIHLQVTAGSGKSGKPEE